MAKIRIQKALSAAGVASRRAVEEMIVEGRISVNGELVAKLPCFVDLPEDTVRVDGKAVRGNRPGAKKIYLLLNKPRGVVCTQSDPQGRPRAIDLVGPIKQRVYCVGRLDCESTGVLIITNDGDLTERLTHPRYGVSKRYVVRVSGSIKGTDLEKLKKPAYIDGRRTGGAKLRIIRRTPTETLLEITLTEGKNREIRRILARLGYNVRRLKRVAIGPITDKGLKAGSFRQLKPSEVNALKRATKIDEKT